MSFKVSAGTAARDLRIVIAARALSLLGDQVALVALLLRTQQRGEGAWPVVWLLLTGMLPLMVLAPAVGRLVDRTDSRRLLLVSSSGQLACCVALAYCQDFGLTLALVALLGAGQSVNAATWQALLPRIAGVGRLAAALGLSQAAGTMAAIGAPVLGGLLTGWYGARPPLLLDAASFAVVAVAALAVRTRRGGETADADADRRGGWAILRGDRVLTLLVGMLSLFVLLGSMVNVVEVFLVRESLHASASWYGVLGGAWGAGVFGGALLGRQLAHQQALLRAALGGCALLGLSLAGMGLAPSVAWVLPAAVAGGTANGLLSLSVNALVGIRTAEAVRGRVSATVNGLTSSGQVGALLLGGLLATVLAPRQIFVLAGLLGLVAPVLLCRRLLRAAAVPAAAVSAAAVPSAAVPSAAVPAAPAAAVSAVAG